MVLELDRQTLFPYPVAEEPSSIIYAPESVIGRIFYLEDVDPIVTNLALRLLQESVEGTHFPTSTVPMATEMWDEPRSLVNHLLTNEEIRVTQPDAWRILRMLLIGKFEPQKILNEINTLGFISKETDQWKLLEGLTLCKKNSQDKDCDHI